MKEFLLCSALLILSVKLYAQTPNSNGVLFVNISKTNGTGNSWNSPVKELADALKAASGSSQIKEIWVAGGTYKPLYTPEDGQNFTASPANSRDKAFLLVNNVKVYGGFAGTEATLSDRDLSLTENKSILSGDIEAQGDKSDNTYHIVVSAGDVGLAELNGFTITAANGDDSGSSIFVNGKPCARNYGGGMLNFDSSPIIDHIIFSANNSGGGGGLNNTAGSSPLVSNTKFLRNTATNGGGIENSASSSPVLNNIVFLENTANSGGGIHNESNASPFITNTVFSGNAAVDGGGINNISGCSPIIINTVFSGNIATKNGGALFNDFFCSPIITNSVLSGNEAINAGGIFNNSSTCTIRNSIILGNSSGVNRSDTQSIYCSLIQGLTSTADGNLDATGITAAQVFTSAPDYSTAPFTGGDYTLLVNSPVINKGDKTFFNTGLSPDLSAITIDLAGNPRVFGSQIDMGAFELQNDPVMPVTLTKLNARKQLNEALIEWSTALESNNKGFIVSRSADGRNFTELGVVNAKGNYSSYVFSDNNPLNGMNYYSLQQQDLDGKISSLGIKNLSFDPPGGSVTIYPNPTHEKITVRYAAKVYQTLHINDINGRKLLSKKITPESTSEVLSLANLNAGTYMVMLSGTANTEVLKVVKL
ncbi:T9SS type A sorting domain-containing protein [Desertivirga xinjiangensis]|uniref:T9SS type A sorting domain-containing protein n=1 Tax=Desertivirga xinjiangensis TaxID=539206 RepID=UPI00210F0209|nr:T9SS type A sorting domain-containing protein [Pedobacter xinjiangensis]